MTTSGSLPFTLDVATRRAEPGSPDYRKAYIYVLPANGGYNVTVRIQHGTDITTTTSNYAVSKPPENLRIGFAGSTGNFNNYHEIRYLTVLDNPVAVDDAAQTRYDKAVDIPVLNNDQGIGAAIDPTTVDLDPNKAGLQTELLVEDKGTFTVNDKGVVTFTPLGTFSGVVSIPYVVSDTDLRLSNPATISVTVTGADVATSVTGPATALPGSQVTYTVSTTNIGLETATDVIPTLLLPAGLVIAASTDYIYNSTTGLVTFNQTTLAANQTASNSVVVSMPSSGTITATSNYTYPIGAVVPDPVSANNSATIRTTVTGLSTVITTCATPGKDGPAILDNTSVPNTYYPGISTTTAGGVFSTITVGMPVGTMLVTVGDLVLVMQMQDGANMSTTNSSSYGTSGSTTAGQYEYAAVTSVVNSANGSTFTLSKLLTNIYTTTAGANQNFQVIRVPQYSVLTINGTATGTAWNSTTKTGGVLALDVVGTTTFTTGGGLSMNAKGFSGGGGVSYEGAGTGATNSTDDYATLTSLGAHGAKGEGIAGTPHYYYNGTAVVDNQVEGYATGDNNIGAPANGGGGAQDFAPATNTGNSGGGGGANAGVGGLGGYGYNTTGSTGNRAIGGRTFNGTAMALIMGGGGGAGSSSTNTINTAVNSSGGIGGGIIILRTNTTSGAATIQANGGDAASAGSLSNQGGGGGGAGGSVLVLATATGSNITTSANGGNGSSVNTTPGAASYGPGGGGSGGFVYKTNGTLGTVTSTHGANGQTNNGQPGATAALVDFGATDGADGITNATIEAANTNTMGGTSSCYPDLSMALSTSTPNVTRSSSGPNPAMYTATISNVGGAAYNTSTTIALNSLFAYDASLTPTLILTTASGTTTTLAPSDYSVTGTTSPVFSGLFIPSGTTLSITFRATISANAENNTPYQAAATVVYANPTRETTNGTDASAQGNGYASASSTAEDVTIVTPLPVDLTRFDVLAVRQDAILSWATASELHNDHFTVERSTTGSEFRPIGTVRGAGTSVRTTEYSFTDNGAGRLAAETVYYRLQQVDLEGNKSYSPVRTVHFAATKATAVLYPNPSQGQITLDLSTLATGTYTVQVLDLAGRVVRTQQSSAVAAPLDLSGLPQGAYMVMIQGANVRQALPLLRN